MLRYLWLRDTVDVEYVLTWNEMHCYKYQWVGLSSSDEWRLNCAK